MNFIEDDFEVDDETAQPTTPTSSFDRLSLDNNGSQLKTAKHQRPRAPSPEPEIYYLYQEKDRFRLKEKPQTVNWVMNIRPNKDMNLHE